MRDIHRDIIEIESKVTFNISIVQEDILPQLKMILSDLQQASTRLAQMKEDIAAY